MYKIGILILILTVMVGTATATQITFTDVTCLNSGADVCSTKMFLYYQNGTVAGILSGTNDNVTVGDGEAINIYLKANSQSLLNNNAFVFDYILNSWQVFFVLLLIMGLPLGFFYVMRKMYYSNRGTNPTTNNGWRKRF